MFDLITCQMTNEATSFPLARTPVCSRPILFLHLMNKCLTINGIHNERFWETELESTLVLYIGYYRAGWYRGKYLVDTNSRLKCRPNLFTRLIF
jgi:hypothetical protein